LRQAARIANLAGNDLAIQARRHGKLTDVGIGPLLKPGAASFINQNVAQQIVQVRVLHAKGQRESYQRTQHAFARA